MSADLTPEGSPISPTEKAEKAIERKAWAAFQRALLYGIGVVAFGGAGVGTWAHSRVTDEHDATLLNTQSIKALEDAMRMEAEERKADSIHVSDKLDRLREMLLDRDVSTPTNLGRSR